MNTFLLILLGLYVFWNLYVYTMGIYRAFLQKRLKGLSLIMSAPILALMFALDIAMQYTVAWLVFWDKPRDIFVTGRLRRYIKQGEGWRYKLADVMCKYLLDPFDPTGAHCDDEPPVLKG
jgi:hypothetical protein